MVHPRDVTAVQIDNYRVCVVRVTDSAADALWSRALVQNMLSDGLSSPLVGRTRATKADPRRLVGVETKGRGAP